MPNRQIADVMSQRQLVTVKVLDSVREAAKKMSAHHVAAVVILNDAAGLEGIFTERDMIDRVVAPGLDPDETPVKLVMTKNPVTIEATATVRRALSEMGGHRLRHLPVTRGGAVIGMISFRDFVGLELAEFDAEQDFEKKVWETAG